VRHTITVLGLAAVLTLSLGHAALAAEQHEAMGNQDMFQTMDHNKDGVLTKDEFAGTPMANDFDKYDRNHDGKVTRQEFGATAQMPQTNMPGM